MHQQLLRFLSFEPVEPLEPQVDWIHEEYLIRHVGRVLVLLGLHPKGRVLLADASEMHFLFFHLEVFEGVPMGFFAGLVDEARGFRVEDIVEPFGRLAEGHGVVSPVEKNFVGVVIEADIREVVDAVDADHFWVGFGVDQSYFDADWLQLQIGHESH